MMQRRNEVNVSNELIWRFLFLTFVLVFLSIEELVGRYVHMLVSSLPTKLDVILDKTERLSK